MEVLNYNTIQLRQALGINEHKLRELVNSGRIPFIRMGKRLVFPKVAIDKWLLEQAEASLKA